jgi:hypothetical protein
MIENRILWALLLILVLAAGSGWLLMRKVIQRKEFKERQLGRGKVQKPVSFEPAE